MRKQIVNEDQFIELCNQALQQHPNYKTGMEIVGVPQDASGADLSGYKWNGPDYTVGIVAEVVHHIRNKYELRVTPR